MSLIPLFYRDWWEDLDRPSRLLDQNFGLSLNRDELLNSLSSLSSPVLRTGYVRPWRSLLRQNSGISTLQADKERFQVILDVQQFSPNEITVKTVDRTVLVEGKHEEKPDEHGYISRHFVRKYLLPEDIEPLQVTSTLSSDGVLTITAPKKTPTQAIGERQVPILPTGPARPQPTVEAPASPTPSVAPAPSAVETPAPPSKPEGIQIPVTITQ